MNRREYAAQIVKKIAERKSYFIGQFFSHKVNSFIVDDILSEEVAKQIYHAFPKPEDMKIRSSLRECKYVAAQMNLYNPILEEIVYAFQEPEVVSAIGEITKISQLMPDNQLYAGGISLMGQGNFLNPHLDNSHENARKNYRVLNLLYYVTPDWQESYGGNLELWDNGVKNKPRTICSKFNRLVVMATNKSSYHSVSPVVYDGYRCCVSNYYFSPNSMEGEDYFHITSFRGRPEQPLRDLILMSDSAIRNGIRKVFPKGVWKTFHIYKK